MTDERAGSSPAPHALLAGGGTAGHVFPAIAVAEELSSRGWTVSWIGRQGSMEERLVIGRGLPFHALPASPVVGRGLLGRAMALATAGRSALRARRLTRDLDGRVVLGTGGYVSVPTVLGGRLAGRPTVLLEPNARAGSANRWLSRFAVGAAIAYDGARRDFRCPVRLTGVPVRREFFRVARVASAEVPRILILGGSSGALKVNRYLPAVFEQVASRVPHLEIVHQVGPHEEVTREEYARHGLAAGSRSGLSLRLVAFIEDVAGEMERAHLVISRAGAVTLAELCAAGRPAVLIPLALAGAHQRENAEALVAAGGAELLEEGAPVAGAAELLVGLLEDAARRRAMGVALAGLSREGAATAIADLVVEAGGEA